MKLAILLLCHEPPRQLARRLASNFFQHADVKVYVHYDAKRNAARLKELQGLLPAGMQVSFVEQRVHCRWGEYSLVEATHRLMKLALADTAFAADRLCLLSGSCVPYRPVASLQAFLLQHPDREFIEAKDIARGRWVKDGLEAERFKFYFPFNFITHKKWFERAVEWQRHLKVSRKAPEGLRIHFGSQWFCLTRATAALVAQALDQPALRSFFRWSWIPDEFAIQTLAASVCKPSQIADHSLTYYEFDEQGRPLVLDNGHLEHLLKQPFFFARKLAPEAAALMQQLDARTAEAEADHSYFKRAGSPTIDYQRHLVVVATQKSMRARVGSTKDMWRGPMDSNRRYYYVLYSASRPWLLRLIRSARSDSGSGLPLFELPFDARNMEVAGGGVRYLGFGPEDKFRRDHDPAAYLYELVNAHPHQPTALGLDFRRASWTRDFVRWDASATLVNCDPWLSREQLASTALDELDSAADREIVRETLVGMNGGGPLPDDFVAQFRASKEHTCQFATLRDLGTDLGDATLLALRDALASLDSISYFPTQDAAWRRFWR